jgi:transposase InsO family protein
MKADRDASLVMDALMMAVWQRGKADTLLHPSDQGSQYTSEQFQRLLADNDIICPMSRAGNVWDRAMGTPLARETMARSAMESFLSSLKTERAARKICRTRDEARADVFDYIERLYDPRRRHSKLGCLSQMEFEARAYASLTCCPRNRQQLTPRSWKMRARPSSWCSANFRDSVLSPWRRNRAPMPWTRCGSCGQWGSCLSR